MSYLTAQRHSSALAATSLLTALARAQKHPPATQNNAFLPTFIVSFCITWEFTISGHQHCSCEACSPVSWQAHAGSSGTTAMPPPARGQSPRRSGPAAEEQPPPVNASSLGRARGCPPPAALPVANSRQPSLGHGTRRHYGVLRLSLWQKPSTVTYCQGDFCNPPASLPVLLLQLRHNILRIPHWYQAAANPS